MNPEPKKIRIAQRNSIQNISRTHSNSGPYFWQKRVAMARAARVRKKDGIELTPANVQ